MKTIKEIDDIITVQLNELKTISDQSRFQFICEFSLKEIENIPFSKMEKTSGIYMLEIKKPQNIGFNDWIISFKPKFRGKNKEFLHKFTPNIIEKRLLTHQKQNKIKEWIPFYIGKSSNIGKRIETHINSVLGRPPFALKLKDRENLNDEIFRIHILELEIVNYNVIAPIIEKNLRNNYAPIVGKQ